ncbi:unnamed protein product [Symbiodinium natans]|uniref:Uncharacterized protein n=1 Tax=Symbiodinium natans TaxID=878477 RepID=A0A812QET0_9DINO|nr:unnamed protein product [Symbiodinium natans]
MPSSSPGYTIPGPGVAWQQRTAISQTAGPTRVKQTPLGLGVDLLNAGGSEPATVEVSASSPVHKLVEPPHLLRTALESTEDDQDDEDQLWRRVANGTCWHALYVGQFLLTACDDGAKLSILGEGSEQLPPCVVAIQFFEGSRGSVCRIPLADFVDASKGPGDCADLDDCSSPARVTAADISVRLYTRRPRGRRAAVARALMAIGAQVDSAAVGSLPELLPWWAIFDEAESFQPGLCASRSRAVRYRLSPKAEGSTVPPQLLDAVLSGGAVVRQGRVVLRGLRLVKALRVGKAAGALASAGTSWANLGGFVGQAIAGSLLDDGNATTAMATAAGGWAGGLAGSGVAAAAASSLGIEALGAGSVAGGLVVCGSLSAVGAVAGAGLAFAVKRLVADQGAQPDRSAEYFDCPLRLLGSADDVFHLFGASLEFPPEDGVVLSGEAEETPRLAAAGWYAVRVSGALPAD